MNPKRVFKGQEQLYVRSMGKNLLVTAIFTDQKEANGRMLKTNDAVVAVFGPFIILADKGDLGTDIEEKD